MIKRILASAADVIPEGAVVALDDNGHPYALITRSVLVRYKYADVTYQQRFECVRGIACGDAVAFVPDRDMALLRSAIAGVDAPFGTAISADEQTVASMIHEFSKHQVDK